MMDEESLSSSYGSVLSEEEVNQAVKKHLVSSDNIAQLPGCSVTHEIYKWSKDQERGKIKRSQSEYKPQNPAATNLKNPGGFRRYFVTHQKKKQLPNWIAHSFVDFLAMYGRFGGENLTDVEQRPLLQPKQGNASSTKAVFLLLKSFIGTGVMFLPKA